MIGTYSIVAFLTYLLPIVAAHGYMAIITIDGKQYLGNDVPKLTNNPSVIRRIDSINPVKGATNPSVNCGTNSEKASLVADANPGSKVEFTWKSGEDTNWPHNTGVVMTYMANCGKTTCDKFDAAGAKWFKIDQSGIVSSPSASSVVWAQAAIMTGKPYTLHLPSNIAPGNYLIRHELLALQLATNAGGAEFYPSCSQVKIGGDGTGTPKSSELVSLPGAYSDTDPGILDANVFDPGHTYTFPGPAIASFVKGTGSSGSANAGALPSSTVPPQPTGSSKSKDCKRSGGSKRSLATSKRRGLKARQNRL